MEEKEEDTIKKQVEEAESGIRRITQQSFRVKLWNLIYAVDQSINKIKNNDNRKLINCQISTQRCFIHLKIFLKINYQTFISPPKIFI